jgi:hypothetical protein
VAKRRPRKTEEIRTKIIKIKAEIDNPPPPPKPSGGPLDKALDLVKWIDSPFKLFSVILLAVLGLIGYLIYSHQDKLVTSLTARETMPELLADERLASLGRDLIRDLRAETDGRFSPLEGKKGAFFSGSPARNRAAVAMLNGEVLCEKFEASSDAGDWLLSRGVTYACRGSVPPEAGSMVGYLAVGFKTEPRDIVAVKSRITQTTREMAR